MQSCSTSVAADLAPKLPNATVLEEMTAWFSSGLRCIAGRREFQKGRYLIRVVDDDDDILDLFSEYTRRLAAQESVGCLFVFNEPAFYKSGPASVEDAMAYLSDRMAILSDVPATTLLNGGALNKRLTLPCPVTGAQTEYDDFDAIAFCPQAEDESDPLYDPLMSAPYLCVNITSDIFAFAMFARDTSELHAGRAPYEIEDPAQAKNILSRCAEPWQRMAEKTIKNYAAITNTARCPVHLTEDRRNWVAFHKDPAFAETKKERYIHNMPLIYANAVIDAWASYFDRGESISLSQVSTAGVLS
jgi:hypothetical protein